MYMIRRNLAKKLGAKPQLKTSAFLRTYEFKNPGLGRELERLK